MTLNGMRFQDLFKGSLFYKLDYFCDAVVTSQDGVEFKAHKLFLSKGSGYFHAFFRSNFGDEDTVTLAFDSDILENILIYLYIGEIYMDKTNIAELIIAADYLLIDALMVRCKDFALRSISFNCGVSLLNASYAVERLRLTDHCFRFVQIYFERIVREGNSDIEKLPFHVFRDLLKGDSLGTSEEDTVWKAIVIWVEGETEDRLKHVPELLSCMRWSAINFSLAPSIAKHSVFRDNEFCKSMNLEELIKAPEQQAVMTTARYPRKMYVFAGRKRHSNSGDSYSAMDIFLTYDGRLDMWRKIGETDINYTSLFAIGRFVFMFNTISCNMKTFDLFNSNWQIMNTCNSSRQGYYVAQSQGAIFVIGGSPSIVIGGTLLSNPAERYEATIERYDPAADHWTYIAPLSPAIHVCGAIFVDDKLYVIGYIENAEMLEMRALVYDRVRNVWTDIKKPRNFRTNFALINFHDRMHIFGGLSEDLSATTLAEVYHSEEDEWMSFPDLPFPYERPKAAILKDKLMVYEDLGESSPPSIWNESVQTWEVDFQFDREIHRYQFCCIDDQQILQELAKKNRDPKVVWMKTPFENC